MKKVFLHSKKEWLTLGGFTEEELDNVREDGFIGTRNGCDCYISKLVPTKTMVYESPELLVP